MSQTLFQFSGERLGVIEWCDPARGDTLVADSWLVVDGHAVATDRHRRRFVEACARHGLGDSSVAGFFESVLAHIPREGEWFPRVELVQTPGGPTLRYRERSAPNRLSTAVLALAHHDPRTSPMVKGPDLESLQALRARVAEVGATEAVIATRDGVLVEGAYSTLVVWPAGADAMVLPPAALPRIASVTESVLRDLAREWAIEVTEAPTRVDDLEGAEVWVISALHGIRLVTEFVGGPALATGRARSEAWFQAWWDRRSPLDG